MYKAQLLRSVSLSDEYVTGLQGAHDAIIKYMWRKYVGSCDASMCANAAQI